MYPPLSLLRSDISPRWGGVREIKEPPSGAAAPRRLPPLRGGSVVCWRGECGLLAGGVWFAGGGNVVCWRGECGLLARGEYGLLAGGVCFWGGGGV